MTFDIKTINKENIEETLNTCSDVIKMIIELQKKYNKKFEEDKKCKEDIERKKNACLDEINMIIELQKIYDQEDEDEEDVVV